MTLLLGATAMTVDLGNAWRHRRAVITATDAAALAAAQEYALGGVGCSSLAEAYVAANMDDADMTACSPMGTHLSGRVTVTANTTVDYVFAPILGSDSGVVGSSTTVGWGQPVSVGSGMRPFGLCVDALAASAEFMAWTREAPTDPIEITYGKDGQPNACNGGDSVDGNWGLIDFNGGSNSNNETKDWVENGYEGEVGLGWYEGDPGAFSNTLGSSMNALISSGEIFGLPIFEQATSSGANAEFYLVGFAAVQLVDFKANGSASGRSLTLIFHPDLLEGACCNTDLTLDLGGRVVQICAVDDRSLDGCPS